VFKTKIWPRNGQDFVDENVCTPGQLGRYSLMSSRLFFFIGDSTAR
jgi:hypothetical protein